MFHEITNNSDKFKTCFSSAKTFDQQSEDWKQFFFADVNKVFKKIRITNKVKKTEIVELMEKRSELKQKLQISSADEHESVNQKINEIKVKFQTCPQKRVMKKLRIPFKL